MPEAPAATEDYLLGGRVTLSQPSTGYRAAIDPVLLAAAVPVESGQHVLDVGCGTGAASLCLAERAPDVHVTGIELDADLVRFASHNIRLNGRERVVDVLNGDLARPPPRLSPKSFDHVMANPPYFREGEGRLPRDALRRQAHFEGAADLAAWVRFSLDMTRSGGSVTLIHRADRLADLLVLLGERAGDILIFPLWSYDPFAATPRPAKRVIVQALAGSRVPLKLCGGMVLHDENGDYTPQAEALLRDGAPLALNGKGDHTCSPASRPA